MFVPSDADIQTLHSVSLYRYKSSVVIISPSDKNEFCILATVQRSKTLDILLQFGCRFTPKKIFCQSCRDAARIYRKVQVGKDQEKAQSEKDSHSKNRGGKKTN